MEGTIILMTNRFYWIKTYYFCSVKLRYHHEVDAAILLVGNNKTSITMENTTNISEKKRMRRTQKQVIRSKKAEANARRKVNKKWQDVEKTDRYRKAAIKNFYHHVTREIEIEVLDGIFLNLNVRNQKKSSNVQNRLLRRIVEKRQAQANHKKNGRTEDLTSMHIFISCTTRCMEDIHKKRFAA